MWVLRPWGNRVGRWAAVRLLMPWPSRSLYLQFTNAVEVLSGGEIAFSMEQDIFSESLGPLYHGDVLSARADTWRAQDRRCKKTC